MDSSISTVECQSVAGVVVSCKIPILVTRVRFPGGALTALPVTAEVYGSVLLPYKISASDMNFLSNRRASALERCSEGDGLHASNQMVVNEREQIELWPSEI